MCDIEKIFKKLRRRFEAKTQSEKIAYLKSYGFQIADETKKSTPIKGAS